MTTADLHAAWEEARAAKESEGTDAADHAEQAAWDALVDYVEEHDLTASESDPRNASKEASR